MHIDPALPIIVGAIVAILLIGLALVSGELGLSTALGAYAGALLSQIGAFSFILAALAHTADALADDMYRMIVALIAISLLQSPGWIGLCKVLLGHPEGRPDRQRSA